MELQGSGELFAMKAMDKSVMLNRNKVNLEINVMTCSVVFFDIHFMLSNSWSHCYGQVQPLGVFFRSVIKLVVQP